MDGVLPECWDGQCKVGIDELTDDDWKLLNMRGMLISLEGLGIGGEILKMYEATKEDIELLAVIEDELKPVTPA